MIDTPKNLTKNILLGMFLGFVIGVLADIHDPFYLKNIFAFLAFVEFFFYY